jgi:hypothetical protein
MANETLREMVQGFTTMQAQLGLVPTQGQVSPLGATFPPPPPMPTVPTPAMASAAAMQMSAASGGVRPVDVTWSSTMSQLGARQVDPYSLRPGTMNVPSPMYDTAPNYGMYRPQAPPRPAPAPVGVFNPYALAGGPVPSFSTPAAFAASQLHAEQARMVGMMTTGTHVAGSLGGSFLGGAIGAGIGALIPLPGMAALGGLAGSYLGGRAGDAFAGLMTGPALNDMSRAADLRRMTATTMVSGPQLDMLTGQGLTRSASNRLSLGIRDVARDWDFGRQTGYNAADLTRIAGLGAQAGMMDGVGADNMVKHVRDMAKVVKLFAQVTGDPDVRSAVEQLGKLQQLGFAGPAGSMGAVANRSMFARMAGVSSSAMHDQYGMPGAMSAQGLGLAGSTGYSAGVAGAGLAGVSVSAGAFDPLQLARAGGRQGVAQTNLMASLGAANQDLYMAASLRRKSDGSIDVDTDAYRRAQGMTISEVAAEAGRRLSEAGMRGISDLSTRRQEFKDRLAASQSPLEQQLNVVRQAQAMQRETGLTFGGALSVMVGSTAEGAGMSREQREQVARTLELQYTSAGFYRGTGQQLDVERRNVVSRARAERAPYASPGLLRSMGRGIGDAALSASDAVTSPFRAASRWAENRAAERAAIDRGERLERLDPTLTIRDERERQLAVAALADPSMAQLRQGRESDFNEMAVTALGNYAWSTFGYGKLDDVNIAGQTAARARGDLLDFSLRSRSSDLRTVRGATEAAHALSRARGLDEAAGGRILAGLQARGGASVGANFNAAEFIRKVARRTDGKVQKNGILSDAGALTTDHINEAAKEELESLNPADRAAAQKFLREARGDVHTMVTQNLLMFGGQKTQEVLGKTLEVATQAGALSGNLSKEALSKMVGERVSTVAGSDSAGMRNLLASQDAEAISYAALQRAADSGDKGASEALGRLHDKLGKDPQALQRLQLRAGSIVRGADKDTLKALEHAGRRGGNVEGEIRDAQKLLFGAKGQAAYESELGKLGDRVTAIRGMEASDPRRVLDTIVTRGGDDVQRLPAGIRKIVDRYRNGSAAERDQATRDFRTELARRGSSSEEDLTGATSHEAGMERLERDQESLQDMRRQLSGDSKSDKVVATAASAVSLFADTVKELKGVLEEQRLSGANLFQPR